MDLNDKTSHGHKAVHIPQPEIYSVVNRQLQLISHDLCLHLIATYYVMTLNNYENWLLFIMV